MNRKIEIKSILYFLVCLLVGLYCTKKSDIVKLLKSDDSYDIIRGAYYAGESGRQDYVPLLLTNAADKRRSTNLRYYGISVYQEKMIALGKIYKKYPSNEIGPIPDSAVILFYINLFNAK